MLLYRGAKKFVITRFRIREYDNKFSVEGKIKGKWYKLPSFTYWCDELDLGENPLSMKHVVFYNTMNEALKLETQYKAMYITIG